MDCSLATNLNRQMDIVARAVATHVKSHRGKGPRRGFLPTREPWHDLCRQIGTGGLQCPDLAQRRRAIIFSSGGVVQRRVSRCHQSNATPIRRAFRQTT